MFIFEQETSIFTMLQILNIFISSNWSSMIAKFCLAIFDFINVDWNNFNFPILEFDLLSSCDIIHSQLLSQYCFSIWINFPQKLIDSYYSNHEINKFLLLKSSSDFQSLLTIRLTWGHWGRPRQPEEVPDMILILLLMPLTLLLTTMVDLEEALSLMTTRMLYKFCKGVNLPYHRQRLKMYWTTNWGRWKKGARVKNVTLRFSNLNCSKRF